MASDHPSRRLPRGRHGLPRGEVVRQQRERLLEAVPRVVAAKGYAAATIEDIAAAAGVSRRAFYENFHDKEGCFVAAYRAYARQLSVVIDAASASGHSWHERLRLGVAAGLRFFATQPDVARMAVIEVLAAGPAALAERDTGLARLARLGDEAFEAGDGAAPRLLLEMISGGIAQLVYTWVLHGRASELEQLQPAIMYLALVPFLGPLDASRRVAAARVAMSPSGRGPAPPARRD